MTYEIRKLLKNDEIKIKKNFKKKTSCLVNRSGSRVESLESARKKYECCLVIFGVRI